MSLCLQAAFGVHPVMSLIKLWKTVFFLSWMWEIGLSLITWEQILSMNHLLSMIFRGQLFITWCHTVIGKMDFYFFLKQIGYLRWQGLLVLILWWMHNLKVLTEWSFKHNWKTSYFIVLFIVHLLCGFMVFVLKFKCLDFFFFLRYEMQDAGITSDTMMKNFFFVPSCIQLSQEDNFSTEA